ncbi:MAG TPA: TSUP family transporter [Chitinophagaceae bacterium]|jgi:uncharacterized membrane protein YfcA|nr:TSUP family transporter [Chitinophagaceae bacterium]
MSVNKKTIPLNGFQPVLLEQERLHLLIVGGGDEALKQLQALRKPVSMKSVTVVGSELEKGVKEFAGVYSNFIVLEKEFSIDDLQEKNLVIAATNDVLLDEKVRYEASLRNILVHSATRPGQSDFFIMNGDLSPYSNRVPDRSIVPAGNPEKKWKRIATWLVIVFGLMITGHLILSALPIPAVQELIGEIKPYFDQQFLFFILAGFAAQMVDGVLSMGYGVTSATCLMSFGISPVSVSAAIHTSEIFTTGISGYSHYKFGNVNKKLFRHLLVPGVLGAIAGAILLVFLGEKAGKWLMPVIALYAMFLGLKILVKAFRKNKPGPKVKRIGWLAGAGGFLDSFGGGGWGPIVTSTLISKGRNPKYTIGSVSLTEFFVTLASATTFFIMVGVHHWNIVLGLIIGGSIAAPIAARLTGRLPKKTMMIAVGIMVMIWCARMIIKSFF